MKNISLFATLLFALFFTATACSSDERPDSSQQMVDGDGIEIEGAWARPGSEGRMSAAYFLITNFTDEDDRLLSAKSDVAQNVEIHESYEQENDMVGMRELESVDIPVQSTIRLEQGGMHIMLIQLTRSISDGDSFELILNFENYGEVVLDIPVRL